MREKKRRSSYVPASAYCVLRTDYLARMTYRTVSAAAYHREIQLGSPTAHNKGPALLLHPGASWSAVLGHEQGL